MTSDSDIVKSKLKTTLTKRNGDERLAEELNL
jgi:hypothetical protein